MPPNPSETSLDSSTDSSDTDLNSGVGEDLPRMNTMAMIHINAQSLRNKVDELELESEGFDIVAITETWLKPEITADDVKLPGYNMFRRDRAGDAHGGVALYIRENIIGKERADLQIPDLEAIWAEILVENRKILIGCMYRPPNAPAAYWNKVEASLEQAKSTGTNHIFLLGDLNCNMFTKGNKLHQILDDLHMTQLIDDTTHRTAYSETLIDIIATNSLDLVEDIKIKEPSLSNHCDVAALIKIRTHKQRGVKRSVYNYEEADWQGLSRAVETFDWEDILRLDTVDDQVTGWTRQMKSLIDEHIPQRTVLTGNSNKPWLTDSITKLKKRKAKAHKKMVQSNTEAYRRKFNRLRNKLKRKIQTAKSKHKAILNEKISNSQGNNEKLWWKLVKDFYSKSANSKERSPPLLINGVATKSDLEKAEAFNSFFAEMAQVDDTKASIPEDPINEPEQILSRIQIPCNTVKETLENLDPTKACGPDTISTRILKNIAKATAPTL
jgi:hypothetical protein